jgi:hypothetical protein
MKHFLYTVQEDTISNCVQTENPEMRKIHDHGHGIFTYPGYQIKYLQIHSLQTCYPHYNSSFNDTQYRRTLSNLVQTPTQQKPGNAKIP